MGAKRAATKLPGRAQGPTPDVESSKQRIFAGLLRRSIMLVTPPCLSASPTVSQPYCTSFAA